jgi:8-oxo-dGTP pyrophosphatase MutT (NUDIX family)
MKRVVVIAVQHPILEGLFLHGKRRDSQKWCAPSGHVEKGETDVESAHRELLEETGIDAREFHRLHEMPLPSGDGTLILYSAKLPQKYDMEGYKNDPDQEFSELKFLNPQQSGNWQIPKNNNILLAWLKQERVRREKLSSTTSEQAADSMMDGDQRTEKSEFKKKIPGGLAAGKKHSDFDQKKLKQGANVEKEHTSDPSVAREIAMDHLQEDPEYYAKLRSVEDPKLKKSPVVSSGYENVREDMDWDSQHARLGRHLKTYRHKALGRKIHVFREQGSGDENEPKSITHYVITQDDQPHSRAISSVQVSSGDPYFEIPDSHHISFSATQPGHEGKGLNTALKRFAIKQHGQVYSDSRVSPATEHQWTKKLPGKGITVKPGEFGEFDPHLAAYNKPKLKVAKSEISKSSPSYR